MRAVIFRKPLPITDSHALEDVELPVPTPSGRDILVEVKAVSVNPVDVKIRQSAMPETTQGRVLGWDAAGTVMATGPDVKNFAKGDEVFYAGSLNRPGTNAEFHLVDERIVGHKPRSLTWAEAAALPLTGLTAWEMLFDRLQIRRAVPGAKPSILIIGGAGGVSSMAIQLVRKLTDLTVIATASRPESRHWVEGLGAHYVIDHSLPMAPQIAALPTGAPGFVFSTNETKHHLADIVALLAPQGHMGLIDDPDFLDVMPLKKKSLSLHWELMFTRPLFDTEDIAQQGTILNEISRLVDKGKIVTTLSEHFGTINAANLKRAHSLIETGRTKGKIVLEGFQ
ncbi:zinc-binding alcohol dehydrogenase family protein [Acetobacteraceae bacterium ESL0709]|nr:zinc-binding alcohol dehydrogenase family protein [Acetobacteraceae bacterium ESL0697]MDF7677527.1 zinc-binding alcohol dehydrogenase family protein [Acetobacteraceae bacterium ESL0709]